MTDRERMDMLRQLAFLEGAGPDVLAQLARGMVERHFAPGQVIVREGDHSYQVESGGCEMFLIVEGNVEVVKGQGQEEMVLAHRGPGDLVGEMGFLEAGPRFATLRALDAVRLLAFSEQDLGGILAQQPLLLQRVVGILSARLRQSDLQMITDLQRKNEELARAYAELQEAQAGLLEKERMERELELARELQQSILPDTFPQLPGFDCAARSRPARQVGGDFYDVINLGKGRVGLVMADVSGKGMSAALFMALTRSLIRAEARRRASPKRVLLSVHRLLMEVSRADMFVTIFYGVFEPASGVLRFASAGHDRPLLYTPATGTCQTLAVKGIVLGFLKDVRLEEAVVEMQPGDQLVLYSDGITDTLSPTDEFFGLDRLRQIVCATAEQSAQVLCDAIFEQVAEFQATAPQYDDAALLVVRAGPPYKEVGGQ